MNKRQASKATARVPILHLYRGAAPTAALDLGWFAEGHGPVLAAVTCLLVVAILIRRTPLVVSLTQTQMLLPSILHNVGAHLPKT